FPVFRVVARSVRFPAPSLASECKSASQNEQSECDENGRGASPLILVCQQNIDNEIFGWIEQSRNASPARTDDIGRRSRIYLASPAERPIHLICHSIYRKRLQK